MHKELTVNSFSNLIVSARVASLYKLESICVVCSWRICCANEATPVLQIAITIWRKPKHVLQQQTPAYITWLRRSPNTQERTGVV